MVVFIKMENWSKLMYIQLWEKKYGGWFVSVQLQWPEQRTKKKIAFILCWARCLESGHLSSGTETGVCNVGWGFCSLTILWLPQGRTFSSHPLSADYCTLKTGLSSVPAMVRLDLPVSGLIKVFRKRRRRNLSGHIKAAACKTKMGRCHWGSY